MAIDSAENRAGGSDRISPMQIAHNPLFTAREKLDLLQQLKIEVTANDNGRVGFSPEEIDEAIQDVKLGVQSGQGSETVLTGDA
jgi:hypothetical protein